MKTADEMFRELGYERGHESIVGYVRYENKKHDDAVTLMEETVEFSDMNGGYYFLVGKEDILACAQLIKEMEEE